MLCFSLPWIEHLLIDLVVIAALVAIIRLFVPLVTSVLGSFGPIVGQIINIVLWAIIAIFVIYIVFGLLSCMLGAGGFSLLPPHH